MTPVQKIIDATFKFMAVKLAEKDKPKKLWAVCAELLVGPGTWVPDIMYMHAHDKMSALAQYYISKPRGKRIKIVGVAPVVGYFVDDNNGDVSV
jgi:hypothetical protein